MTMTIYMGDMVCICIPNDHTQISHTGFKDCLSHDKSYITVELRKANKGRSKQIALLAIDDDGAVDKSSRSESTQGQIVNFIRCRPISQPNLIHVN
jgi:hypothetical protein